MTVSSPPSPRDRWIALIVLCVGMLMIILDTTIVNVALPSIQDDLGFSQSSLAWVVNAYLIAFGGLLLLAGRLGDLVGRRRMFLAGLTVFTIASVLCGAAQTQEMLIGARFVQGVGGAIGVVGRSSVIVSVDMIGPGGMNGRPLKRSSRRGGRRPARPPRRPGCTEPRNSSRFLRGP